MSPSRTTKPAPPEDLLERHVQFELARWRGAGFAETVATEVAALADWLGTVTVAELLPADPIAQTVERHLGAVPVTDELIGLVVDALVAARATLAESTLTPADVVEREDLDRLVEVIGELDEVRRRGIAAVTASSAYQGLVARVLYQGIKSYLLTENVLAKRVPGASSLVRLGQRGMSTAAPGLEKAVDRQLISFVQANIGETLRESRHYLEEHADAETLAELMDEAWAAVATRPLSALVEVVTDQDLEAIGLAAGPLAESLLRSGLVGSLAAGVVREVLQAYGRHQVAALLTDWGVEQGAVVDAVVAIVGPALEHAHASGYLAGRLRARLEPFYASLGER